MDVVSFEKIGEEKWNAFCDASPEAWIRHRSEGLRATLALDGRSKNHSFGIVRDNTLVAIVPLITQPLIGTNSYEFAFSVNHRTSDTHSLPTPAPALLGGLSSVEYENVRTMCFKEIDRLALILDVVRSRMFIDPLTVMAFGAVNTQNPLIAFGYEDAGDSIVTHIVDLRLDEKVLRSRLSKGHRSDLVFAEKQEYQVNFYDGNSITEDIWKAFTCLYELAAGGPIGTSDRMDEIFERVRSGFALLVFICRKGTEEHLLGVLITIYKNGASYGIAATNPQHRMLRGIGQYIQWSIMCELKHLGFNQYDMGWQSGSTPKAESIDNFKRHFGGTPQQLLIGIKTY